MSHIATSSHPGRVGFDALPQSQGRNGANNPQDYGTGYGYEGYAGQVYEGTDYGDGIQPVQGRESLPSYHWERSWTATGPTPGWDYDKAATTGVAATSYETPTSKPPELRRESPNYKPSALRWPFLLCLLAAVLALMGLLAYALRALPVLDAKIEILEQAIFERRSLETAAAAVVHPHVALAIRQTTLTLTQEAVSTVTSTGPEITLRPPSSAFGRVGDNTVTEEEEEPSSEPEPPASKASEDFGNVGGPATVTESEPAFTRPSSDFGGVGSRTVSQQAAATPVFVLPSVATLTDAAGRPTATSTSVPAPVSTPRTTVQTDAQGRPTATLTTLARVEPSVVVSTDADGRPAATATLYPTLPTDPPPASVRVYSLSHGEYFVGMFLPTVLAILLAVPVRALDANARVMQPWHALAAARARGAAGRDSLCLETSGWGAAAASARALARGRALGAVTGALVLASALLVPLAAEAVAFDLRGAGCARGAGTARNCAYVLSVFDQAAGAALGVLAAMAALVAAALALLARWRSGVAANPWSVAGVAALAQDPRLRRLFATLPRGADAPPRLLRSALADRRFRLGFFYGPAGSVEYGVELCDEPAPPAFPPSGARESQTRHAVPAKPKHHLPFLMLGFASRVLFLLLLCGLLALILYYNNTGGDTPFEDFMASESFGVRFLFTGVGVIISFAWGAFFSSIAVVSPYKLLASGPQRAGRSILLAPPTNAFSGLWSALRRRHGFLAAAAATSILSEFLTVFLSNVPFRVTQTYVANRVCTWAAVGILGVMVAVVLASFAVAWPRVPVDPATVAGALYYVCDSPMLDRFAGLSTLPRRDRDRHVRDMDLRYEFGQIAGVSGLTRIGVDASAASPGNPNWAS
ncbi:hypothetical protein GGS23DRAFT_613962 [Durotheca rogersii]|uniref:uncharacterized protein n=1 Tax=Durotheca rogersii TaxID=419775 RepID=UPI00221E8975|nr:uncharacterized protein GGS23DRAFT_613962 [Durotheca rogersii]KAI5860405.1 hypothetical protein GGS23DRAFT_613962 [Durotheca rogersii]